MASSNSASRTVTRENHIDFDGDLCLEVGEGLEAVSFIACSKAMSRASPVFKAMLYGDFAESKKKAARAPEKTEWVVRLPKDEPEAFKTLLNIIHGRVHEVKLNDADENRQLGRLYDITVLWISWELGDAALFERMAKMLVRQLSWENELHDEDMDVLEPPEIYEWIEKTYSQEIVTLISCFEGVHAELLDRTIYNSTEVHDKCTMLMYGVIADYWHNHAAEPLPKSAEENDYSVVTLIYHMDSSISNAMQYSKFKHCTSLMKPITDRVETVVVPTAPALSEAQKRHLKA
ncbi:Uu.00g114120.m01.CDS01 [Anthostomella pinea]|uniref:Uu.00g114120.m01.CDS01 n=1 Tax=Anthostomella pinea TaxID=933095 RepID=A0AAI8YE72_9PEZI|nr:Uu.00g114120.m01.CDS01 [Anthostomella pinea]